MAELSAVIDELPESERELGLRLQATRWTAARTSLRAWRGLRQRGDRLDAAGAQAGTTGARLALAVAGLHAVRERTAVEARELAGRALADGRLLDDPGPESAGFWIAPLVLLWADALEEATRIATDAMDWAQRHGSLPAFAMGAKLRAYAQWRRGSLAEAEADATSALEHAELPGSRHTATARSPTSYWRAASPRRPTRSCARPRASPAAAEPPSTTCSRARVRAEAQRPEEALENLFACGRLEHEWGIRTPASCNWRADAAPLLASLAARRRLTLSPARSSSAAAPSAPRARSAGALQTLGRVESGNSGIALLEQAVGVLAGSPPASSTRTRCSSWAPPCAARAAAPTPAPRSATRLSSRAFAAPMHSQRVHTTSSWPPAPARGATRSTAAAG